MERKVRRLRLNFIFFSFCAEGLTALTIDDFEAATNDYVQKAKLDEVAVLRLSNWLVLMIRAGNAIGRSTPYQLEGVRVNERGEGWGLIRA
jgi:hypothetical protein